ncbi:MAG: phosphatase PAP2 family protein [Paludibacteraceae bacterium]|nr:phosphatase PAP2 family protein [Paludibacteraceae bacterium]
MDYLIHIDQQWLLAINGWHSEWADMLMWYISKSTTWLPLYALLVGLIVYRFGILSPSLCREGRRGSSLLRVLIILAGFAVAVGVSDFVSSGIIKPWVCRLRPTHEPALAGMLHLVNGYTGGLYGFVSSHAANTMACALLFALLYRNKYATVGLMLWVALNCYSRMYLGVHYPADIIGGLAIGALMATLTYGMVRRLVERVDERSEGAGASCKWSEGDEDYPTADS